MHETRAASCVLEGPASSSSSASLSSSSTLLLPLILLSSGLPSAPCSFLDPVHRRNATVTSGNADSPTSGEPKRRLIASPDVNRSARILAAREIDGREVLAQMLSGHWQPVSRPFRALLVGRSRESRERELISERSKARIALSFMHSLGAPANKLFCQGCATVHNR